MPAFHGDRMLGYFWTGALLTLFAGLFPTIMVAFALALVFRMSAVRHSLALGAGIDQRFDPYHPFWLSCRKMAADLTWREGGRADNEY